MKFKVGDIVKYHENQHVYYIRLLSKVKTSPWLNTAVWDKNSVFNIEILSTSDPDEKKGSRHTIALIHLDPNRDPRIASERLYNFNDELEEICNET